MTLLKYGSSTLNEASGQTLWPRSAAAFEDRLQNMKPGFRTLGQKNASVRDFYFSTGASLRLASTYLSTTCLQNVCQSFRRGRWFSVNHDSHLTDLIRDESWRSDESEHLMS